VDVEEDLPPVPLDYVEIDQVLSNLIENAAKYAPPGTAIRVRARRSDREVRVEVADQGPGIAASAVPRLFDPSYRINQGQPLAKGLGLGLAVARGLVEAHGGRIWVEGPPGWGATFTFALPLTKTENASVATSAT
jgi:two-component system sensor histidine kinase KdpD